MIDLGIVKPGSTLYIPFNTFDSNDPSASVTITGLATTDIEVYKDGSATQRASDSGYALLDTDGIDFDTTTGIHGFSIDLADNTTAGFYAAGSQYWVVVASITVDAATVNFVAATFRIGYPDAILDTTIATLASQTSFTLTSGPAEDDALNGRLCIIHDVASAVQVGHAVISDYTGSTKTVTLASGTTFTAAATDNISILGLAPLQPTSAGNTLDVTATGAAGIDWGNIENKTTANDLSGTDIQLVDTVTTYTGNTPQTGDSYARLGAPAGASVSADIADVPTVAEFNARTLAAADYFDPATDAVATVTTLTNLPAITAGWLTATGIAAGALDGKGNWNIGKTGYTLTQSFPNNFADLDITATAGEVSLKAATQASVDAIEADTNELQTDFTDGGRLDLLLDRLITELDTARAEPGQGTPAATTKIGDKIDYLYKAWRNKSTQTATQYSLYDDSGTTIDQKATVSDDATTGTKGEVGTGP